MVFLLRFLDRQGDALARIIRKQLAVDTQNHVVHLYHSIGRGLCANMGYENLPTRGGGASLDTV